MVLNLNEEPITDIQYSSTYTYLVYTCWNQCFVVYYYHYKYCISKQKHI